jgi:hypothetical protein
MSSERDKAPRGLDALALTVLVWTLRVLAFAAVIGALAFEFTGETGRAIPLFALGVGLFVAGGGWRMLDRPTHHH